jgi:hypothetical protein
LKTHAKALAAQAGRAYIHLPMHERMEDNARALAEKDGLADGLVCVYSTMETCRAFRVRFTPGRPQARSRPARLLGDFLFPGWIGTLA